MSRIALKQVRHINISAMKDTGKIQVEIMSIVSVPISANNMSDRRLHCWRIAQPSIRHWSSLNSQLTASTTKKTIRDLIFSLAHTNLGVRRWRWLSSSWHKACRICATEAQGVTACSSATVYSQTRVVTPAAKRKVTVCRPSVCPSVCVSRLFSNVNRASFLSLIERETHLNVTHQGQHTTRPGFTSVRVLWGRTFLLYRWYYTGPYM